MIEILERAEKLESQLIELLYLANHEGFAKLYDGDLDQTKASLKKHLRNLRTDTMQLAEVEEAYFFAGDPGFHNIVRPLIEDVEAIRIDLELEINPKLEAIAKQLAKKAEEVEARDKSLLKQAVEELDKAIALVEAPVAKTAALATAIRILMDFFQAMPK